jgi:hypothetical protein
VAQFARLEAADVSDYRDLCLKRASACRKQAELQPDRREQWLKVAVEWDRHAEESRGRSIATHEVHKGRMIPKPTR